MLLNTDKAREAALWATVEHLLKVGVRTPEELRFFIEFCYGVKIPDTACCSHHQSPWEVLQAYVFEEHGSIAWRNSRGAGKTFTIGLGLATKSILFPGLRALNFAASLPQAEAMWENVTRFLGTGAPKRIQALVGDSVQKQEATLRARRSPETGQDASSVLRVVAGTMKGVNSKHADDLIVDERALMDDRVFREAQGMRTPLHPRKGSLVVISSVKSAGDPMDRIMRDTTSDFKIYDTCILEAVACREKDCSGCKAAVSHSADGQRSATFFDYCQGRLLGQNRPGHYTPQAACAKFKAMGLEAAEAQLFSLAPEGEATAFPQFRLEHNVRDLDARAAMAPGHFVFADFGRSDNTYFAKAYSLGDTVYVADEMSGNRLTIEEWAVRLREAGWQRRCLAMLADEAGHQTTTASKKSTIEQLEDAEWTVFTRKCLSEQGDTDRVRDLLGRRRIIIHPTRVPILRAALQGATNKRIAEGAYLRVLKHDKHSHPAAALRYGVMLLEPDDETDTGPQRWRKK